MKVKVSYFKRSGKWYLDEEYDSKLPDDVEVIHRFKGDTPHGGFPHLWLIWDELRGLMLDGRAPGLVERPGEPCEFIALIEVPDHPHDHPHIVGLSNAEHVAYSS